MAATSFTRTLTAASDPETCWKVLTDVTRVASWVTIIDDVVELEPLARYTAVLMDKVGPFKLRADLAIDVPEAEAPRRIRIVAAGEDRQVASRIGIDATLEITPAGDGRSQIDVNGTYSVVGRVAALGAGTIRQKAAKILDEFFSRAGQDLGAV
jgi:uncharacterized protein